MLKKAILLLGIALLAFFLGRATDHAGSPVHRPRTHPGATGSGRPGRTRAHLRTGCARRACG